MTPAELGITKAAYGRREAAKLLSIGLSKLDELIKDGKLKSMKMGEGRRDKRLIIGASMAELLSKGVNASRPEAAA